MKAMILAAGLGTRLRPHTLHTPKALFPIGEQSLLERILDRLVKAGCRAVIVNTHHLAEAIEAQLAKLNLPIPVATRHEPVILGTGGALKNVADFWGNQPLLVINGDIETDLDLSALYRHHLANPCHATMAVHDCPAHNNVLVDSGSMITGFLAPGDRPGGSTTVLAYTGVQVVDPAVAEMIPDDESSIISVYRRGLEAGWKIQAFRAEGLRWHDIGTPEGYRQAVMEHLAPRAFARLGKGRAASGYFNCQPLTGDGSDRRWFRLTGSTASMVVADHGIRPAAGPVEADAFVAIGKHLKSKGIPVPEIILYHRFSGLVFVEDMGDRHLQQEAAACDYQELKAIYREVIAIWSQMAVKGAEGFDPGWTWQTTHYDRHVILENECHYFRDRFLQQYLAMDIRDGGLENDFSALAAMVEKMSLPGFVHRDFQSRNIMLAANGPQVIDFQGARLGPIQYDLASLLIDPYTGLDAELKQELLSHGMDCLDRHMIFDKQKFLQGYRLCAVCRNLQILGAFSFLSVVKGKTFFSNYIRPATACLLENLRLLNAGQTLPALWKTACRAAELVNASGKG